VIMNHFDDIFEGANANLSLEEKRNVLNPMFENKRNIRWKSH